MRKAVIALACLAASPAEAAMMSYIDEVCRAEKVNACVARLEIGGRFQREVPDGFSGRTKRVLDEDAARAHCANAAAGQCVSTIDILTVPEFKAALAESNRLQRELWEKWLKVLEDTGAILPTSPPQGPSLPPNERQ